MSRWHRAASLFVVACLVVGVIAAFGRDMVRDLVAGAFGETAEAARPLTSAEADRLARMRQLNWDDRWAGVHARIGEGGSQAHAVGWVDWRRPAVYLALSGDQPGVITQLVQAVPGVVATRPSQDLAPATAATATPGPNPEIINPYPPPPDQPPGDGWQVRRLGAAGPAGAPGAPGTLDTVITLLFTIGTDGGQEATEVAGLAEVLARSDAKWLRRDRTAGYEVDVLLGPAVPPTTAPPAAPSGPPGSVSLAEMGGAVQYWLDDAARLHRLDAHLPAETPVRVDLDRASHSPVDVLDLLGGEAISPRRLTDAEVALLSELPQRNQAAGGGEVTLTLPEKDRTVRGSGWLDWHQTIAYLARTPSAEGAGLIWADQYGVAHGAHEPDADGAGAGPPSPPAPAPPDAGWQRAAWEERGDELGGYDLDLLINEALAMSGWEPLDSTLLRERARWLRADQVGGDQVQVYELPREFESELTAGQARMRYWVDDAGVLRRVEIRTRTGGYGQLDLQPGPVPYLGSVP